MKAVVIALGKIGLPLAAQVARRGHQVTGCDVDPSVIESVSAARPPFPGEAGLEEALQEVVGSGALRVQADTAAAVASGADLVLAVPPLYVDEQARPDFGVLDAVVADIGRGLQAGTVVSVETTLPVGTTRGRVAPALEDASGLREGVDFHVVHSPERVFSGRVFRDLALYPKLVGGLSPEGESRAVELYRSFLDAEVWSMGSAEAAEMAKLVETTYRDVNIALANEFARAADAAGLDVKRIIEAANSQPFSHVHQPGVAVGGHCIPVYPRIAREVNERMPAYAIDKLGDVAGRRVLVLGVAYRGGVKETAFSGAVALRDELTARGATAQFSDPLYTADELRDAGFTPWDGEPVDLAIVQADHAEYRELGPEAVPGASVVLDGRDVLDGERFAAGGVQVLRIGRP